MVDSEIDPVATFELYISKLNPLRADLFQRPKKSIKYESSEWYDNQVIGRDPLNNMMKELSIEAELSKHYTNHSIRVTCLTKLDEAGFEIRHIQAVSGHKSEESIKSYSKKCPDNKKKQMAEALGAAFNPKVKPAHQKHPNDIVDFVPIPDNQNEFNIGQIISEVSKEEFIETINQIEREQNQQQTKETEQNANRNQPEPEKQQNKTDENTSKQPQLATTPVSIPEKNQQNDSETALAPTQSVINNVHNQSVNQSLPIVPRLIFQNSSVTVNFNFNK